MDLREQEELFLRSEWLFFAFGSPIHLLLSNKDNPHMRFQILVRVIWERSAMLKTNKRV